MDSLWASIKVDWHAQGACSGTYAEGFFPTVESDVALEAVRQKFCDHCPVRGKCLNSALINGDMGFWGGTSTDQRNSLKRRRTRAKCPVCLGIHLMKIPPTDVFDKDGKVTHTDPPYEVCLACGASWKGELQPEPASDPKVPAAEAELSCA